MEADRRSSESASPRLRSHTWTSPRLGIALQATRPPAASRTNGPPQEVIVEVTRVDRDRIDGIPQWVRPGVVLEKINGNDIKQKTFAQIMRAIKAPRKHEQSITLTFGVEWDTPPPSPSSSLSLSPPSPSPSPSPSQSQSQLPAAHCIENPPMTARDVSVDSKWSVISEELTDIDVDVSDWDYLLEPDECAGRQVGR